MRSAHADTLPRLGLLPSQRTDRLRAACTTSNIISKTKTETKMQTGRQLTGGTKVGTKTNTNVGLPYLLARLNPEVKTSIALRVDTTIKVASRRIGTTLCPDKTKSEPLRTIPLHPSLSDKVGMSRPSVNTLLSLLRFTGAGKKVGMEVIKDEDDTMKIAVAEATKHLVDSRRHLFSLHLLMVAHQHPPQPWGLRSLDAHPKGRSPLPNAMRWGTI